jgi:hypothetical protein
MRVLRMLVRIRVDSRLDGVSRRVDVVDRQFFGAVGVDLGDLRLGFGLGRFPRRLTRGALEATTLAPVLDVCRRRLDGHQPRPVERQIRILRLNRLTDFL